MSASASTAASKVPRTFSIGPLKVQFWDVQHISGDTTCTITADTMTSIYWGFLASSVVQTTAASYSTNTAVFTFTDPAATVKGSVIVFGV